ncbi:SCO family protein [Bacteroidota bacterium]
MNILLPFNQIKKHLSLLFLVTGILLCFMNTLQAKEKNVPEIGIYEHLDEYIPQGLQFYDIDSNLVDFNSLIDKPTILVLVYFTCPGICSPLLDGVAEVIDRADINLGTDYQVLTVSFNSSETPILAKNKRLNYLKQIKKEIDQDYWKWFTGDSANIARLTDAVGFKFKREGKDFIHAASLVVLSPDGKITRYLYGTVFNQFDLKMAVIEASKGQSSPTISKVLKYCFSYDADGKKYVFNITKISATAVILFALSFFLILVLKKKKTKTENQV